MQVNSVRTLSEKSEKSVMGEVILPPINTTSPIEDARTKIARVFRYLLQMHRIKTPPMVHTDGYDWNLDLENVIHLPGVVRGEVHSNSCGEGILLRVGRPEETECPRPSVIFENWLKPGWDDASSEPVVLSTRKIKSGGVDGGTESFDASEERVDAFEDWLEIRRSWASAERHVAESLHLFSELFELSGKFARESEKYQLFLTDGILVFESEFGPVKHPLLLKRIVLDFDAAIPEFRFRETAEPTMLYSPLLRYLGCDGKEILQLREMVAAVSPHPFERQATTQLLKDFVQRFWENGHYFDHPELITEASSPYVYRHPVILLGHRNHGFGESLERYIETIATTEELPESLLRIVGAPHEKASFPPSDEPTSEGVLEGSFSIDPLLTKDANPEQEQVIQRLEETGAVLVQGPPGTGKSHTIANLIGHLLAQNKTILVTSHASKALRVVREKVAEPLQALCVSLLECDEESSKQLEESITGIVNALSGAHQKKLEKEIEKVSQKRDLLRQERSQLRSELLEAIAGEYRAVECSEVSYDPAKIARRLGELAETDAWIPGPVGPELEAPLTEEEIAELYSLTNFVTPEDELFSATELPDPQFLPEPSEFVALFDEVGSLESSKVSLGEQYWAKQNCDPDAISKVRLDLKDASPNLAAQDTWTLECIEAGRMGGETKEAWFAVVRAAEEAATQIPLLETLVTKHRPQFSQPFNPQRGVEICSQIIDRLHALQQSGGGTVQLTPEWQQFVSTVTVNGTAPQQLEEYQSIRNLLEITKLRGELCQVWDALVGPHDGPTAGALGESPELRAKELVGRMTTSLEWASQKWAPIQSQLTELGFDWERFQRDYPAAAVPLGELRQIEHWIDSELPLILAAREKSASLSDSMGTRDNWLKYLKGFPRTGETGALTKLFIQGLKRVDFDAYSLAWRRLGEVLERKPAVLRRQELLEKLQSGAPQLARAIVNREEGHVGGTPPGDFLAAWRYRHWEQTLAECHQVDLDGLQKKLASVQGQLQEATATYVEKLAWAAQLERTGLPQQQALNGWLALHKKIGRGTGKGVMRLREEAQKVLADCRSAVPVWIMPLSRVVESFDIATTRFDVVILDEASQNDVTGLVALALGREAVVVGDHEQVSPYGVGYDSDRMQSLIDEILVDIPNQQLYDGKTSVYDLARQSFGGTIRLLEHFRCVPDIIQFSNFLCYGGEIRPLRERSASSLLPHVVSHHVPNGVAKDKINHVEATEIASLIAAICKRKEYEGCSIGVISMVGTEQAMLIDSILRTKLTVAEYQRRRLLCGNASQFQGDERDVMFISMVDSPKSKPLTLRRRDDAKKVFNVAASRARDQLWVVHSLNPTRDLKPGDLRLQLISHAINPKSLIGDDDEIENEISVSSEFEKCLYEDLVAAGYQTILHFPVGEMPIDIMVEGADGQRIAILCEGDQEEPPEDFVARMDRPMVLTRLGWRITRLRASVYFLDPKRTFSNLVRRLKTAGIEPLSTPQRGVDRDSAEPGVSLRDQVVEAAAKIRARWEASEHTSAT